MHDAQGPLFCTCSYQEFRDDIMVGIPVKASNGRPRWRLRYPLVHMLDLVYPDRHTMSWELAPFEDAYLRKLHHAGVARVRDAALAIRTAEGAGPDVPLVLLCFEQLTTRGKWCHRTLFAAWWEAQTGEPVPELGGRRVPEIAADQPMTYPLF